MRKNKIRILHVAQAACGVDRYIRIENVFVHDGGRIVVRFKYEQSIKKMVHIKF